MTIYHSISFFMHRARSPGGDYGKPKKSCVWSIFIGPIMRWYQVIGTFRAFLGRGLQQMIQIQLTMKSQTRRITLGKINTTPGVLEWIPLSKHPHSFSCFIASAVIPPDDPSQRINTASCNNFSCRFCTNWNQVTWKEDFSTEEGNQGEGKKIAVSCCSHSESRWTLKIKWILAWTGQTSMHFN